MLFGYDSIEKSLFIPLQKKQGASIHHRLSEKGGGQVFFTEIVPFTKYNSCNQNSQHPAEEDNGYSTKEVVPFNRIINSR